MLSIHISVNYSTTHRIYPDCSCFGLSEDNLVSKVLYSCCRYEEASDFV